MVRFTAAAALAAFVSLAVAQGAPKCGPNQLCPADSPCCSAYGQCGVGAYCLGGCDPKFSHSLESCVPNPTCQSKKHTFPNLNNVQSIDRYLGDRSTADWVSSGKPAIYEGGLLMTMAQDTVGTLLATTHYVWYGSITAKMTTSQGKGVVTAFIMMSDVKDEIDFEWIGVDLGVAQSNYYSQGITNYENSENLTVSNTVENEHEYGINWTPDKLEWSIDGNIMRTVQKSDTWNATSNRFDYPQTPSRVMLSLWPAGLPTNAQGTIDWAGGVIDWNSQAMQNGYYYARVSEVNVNCYDPPSGADKQGDKSYVYTDYAATNNTVRMTNDEVTLASLFASGENPDNDPYAAASSAGVKPTVTAQPETVPGMSGGGGRADEDGNANADPEATSAASPAEGGAPAGQGGDGGFSQNFQDPAGQSGAGAVEFGGSIFAVWVAVLGLMVL